MMQGQMVSREDIAVSATQLNWEPKDMQGQSLPQGLYTFELESYSGDEIVATTPVESYARVTEVRGGATSTSLVLQGGVEVPVSAVTALRS